VAVKGGELKNKSEIQTQNVRTVKTPGLHGDWRTKRQPSPIGYSARVDSAKGIGGYGTKKNDRVGEKEA